jgi:hypothetical protein
MVAEPPKETKPAAEAPAKSEAAQDPRLVVPVAGEGVPGAGLAGQSQDKPQFGPKYI